MGGILGACNAISDYLHTLNMGSTLFRLILAMFLGCLIGIDRGMKKRVAGVKTHMIVCMGATLVMMTGDFIHVYSNGAGIGDTARLGAQVVSGIGFLGVGTIIVTGQRHVSGLTTAASLWTSACIGLAVGIVITYLILRLTKGSVKKQAQTESELQQTKSALQKQEELLEKHFAESADLFKVLAQDYQKIYRHMAKSSDELMPDAKTKGLFLQSFMNSDKSTADVEKDHQPRDYSEGSSGLFKAER